jgi:prepilin-type N-terminal cleavage/methylation domain-containing protein
MAGLRERSAGMKIQRGLTLIELLLVLAVVAILAALAMVNIQRAQINAKAAAARANMKTIGAAFEAYAVDWNNFPPHLGGRRMPNNGRVLTARPYWRLTTPVAYLGSNIDQFLDPFVKSHGIVPPTYEYLHSVSPHLWDQVRFLHGFTGGRRVAEINTNANYDCYFLWSRGPGYDGTWRYDRGVWEWGNIFTWSYETPDGSTIVAYDPSNGLTSRGMIYRMGGRLPGWFAKAGHPVAN